MARKTGNLICLDIDALRQLPIARETVGKGLGRRSFLAGAATAAVAATGAGKAAARALSLSTLRVKQKVEKNGAVRSISIAVEGSHAWVLDVTTYDGNPRLTVESSADSMLIRLDGALLPGTLFKINMAARITQSVMSRKVEFRFTDTGVDGRDFTVSADFDAWVRGDADASVKLPKGDLAAIFGADRRLNERLTVQVNGAGEIGYLPNAGFAANSCTYDLRAADSVLNVGAISLAPVLNDGELSKSGTTHVTRVEAERHGHWKGRIDFKTEEGWKGEGSLKGFDRITAELHDPTSALIHLEGQGPFDLAAEGSKDLRFRLDHPRYVLLQQPGYTTAVLAAKLHEQGRWLDFPGVSLEIGPKGDDAEVLFASIESPEGEETYADIQGAIRNATFPLEGAVTQTRTNGTEPIALASWSGQGTRPPTIIQRPPVVNPGAGAALNPQIGPASRLDITAVPKFRLAPFQLEVVRKEDMLALTFEFVNLAFQGGGSSSLVRADATKPAYIAVIFPPQSLAEAHFQEGPDGKPDLPQGNIGVRPIPSRLSGESRLVFWIPNSVQSVAFSLKGDDGKGRNGLLDWARWKPSVTPTAISSYDSPKIRVDGSWVSPLDSVTVRTRALGGIRLSPPEDPSVEEDPGLMQSLKKLAARRGPSVQERVSPATSQPQVSVSSQLGRLAQGIDPTIVFRFIPKGRFAPSALHTQIEMPIRLIISPTENAGWHHAKTLDPTPPNNRHALWHTRLGHRVDPPTAGGEGQLHMFSEDGKSYYKVSANVAEGPFMLATRGGPTIRAIDALDYVAKSELPSATAPMFPVIPDSGVQEFVMDFKARSMLVDSMCFRGTGNGDTEPFDVENLILTSLGGYLKGEWVWREPSVGWTDHSKPALITWRHISTLGRDQYIKLVYRGFLFPTGHKAVLTVVAERKFQTTTNGKIVAYIRSRRFIALRDPLVTFTPSEQLKVGFSSITCTTVQSPILDPFIANTGYAAWSGQQIKDQIVLAVSGGAPVLFQMKGVDQEGRSVTWGQPSVFIRTDHNANNLPALTKIVTEWQKNDNGNLPGGPKRSKLYGQQVAFAPGGGKTPAGEDAEDNTSYPVNNMLLTGKLNTAQGWTLDLPRWKAELFKANISAPAIQMMQGKPPSLGAIHLPGEMFDMEQLQASVEAEALNYAEDDGFDVLIPEAYKQAGFGASNKAQMFLQLVEKYAPTFGDTSKSGGIANPNMIIQGLSKAKGPIGGALNDIANGNIKPEDLLDSGARLLGAVKLFDIIPNPIKIDPGGPESPYIEVLLIYDDGKNKPPTGAKVAVIWKPPLKNWGFPSEPPLFYINNFKAPQPGFSGGPGELKLEGSIKTKFKGGGKPEMVFRGHVKNFRVDLISPASFLLLDFRIIEFVAEVGKPFDVNIDLAKMTFVGPLTFIQKLQDLLNGGGQGMQVVSTDPNADLVSSVLSTADPGIDVYFDVDETGIRCGLTITIPSVSVGMLAIRNISVGVKLNLPFFGDPLSVRFNFCERNNTFQISVMMVTGGGFVAMEINIDGKMTLEAAFEFGGSLSFDIGVASGGVSIMAGIYFRLDVDETGHTNCMVEAYIRLQGNLSVLGLIRISLEFYLSLTYYSDGNRLIGTATLTVEIEILFFSISVSLTVQRQIAGEKSGGSYFFASMDPEALPAADETTKFTEVVSQAQWVQYCETFA